MFRMALVAMIAIVSIGFGSPSSAQDNYPSRPITVVSPWVAGGINDATARVILDQMSKTLGQPLVLESRGGAAGRIGTDYVAKSAKDGYTILFQNTMHAILPAISATLPYDPIKDFVPIAQITNYANILVVNKDLPVSSLAELIEYGRKNPGKLVYGSGGAGSATHFAGELLKTTAKIDMLHVPYKGMSAATQDAMAGHVQIAFDASPKAAIESGHLKALATVGRTRDRRFPDLPTVSEVVPEYKGIASWQGMFVPKGVPDNVVKRLNEALNAALADEAVRAKLQDLGLNIVGGSSDQLAKLMDEDTKLFRKIAEDAKMKF